MNRFDTPLPSIWMGQTKTKGAFHLIRRPIVICSFCSTLHFLVCVLFHLHGTREHKWNWSGFVRESCVNDLRRTMLEVWFELPPLLETFQSICCLSNTPMESGSFYCFILAVRQLRVTSEFLMHSNMTENVEARFHLANDISSLTSYVNSSINCAPDPDEMCTFIAHLKKKRNGT